MSKSLTSLLTATLLTTAALLTPTRADNTTQPATQPTPPACCGDACKNMGGACCTDNKGKISCDMGGNCCIKPGDKKDNPKSTDNNKGMDGMNMGK